MSRYLRTVFTTIILVLIFACSHHDCSVQLNTFVLQLSFTCPCAALPFFTFATVMRCSTFSVPRHFTLLLCTRRPTRSNHSPSRPHCPAPFYFLSPFLYPTDVGSPSRTVLYSLYSITITGTPEVAYNTDLRGITHVYKTVLPTASTPIKQPFLFSH